MAKRETAGFTLIEMVLVLLLVAILAGGGARLLAAGLDSHLTARTISPLADRGRLALERMLLELRGSDCNSLSQPSGPGSLQLTYNQDQWLIFQNSPSDPQLVTMQVDGGAEKIVIEGVEANSLQFSLDQDRCLVTVALTLTGTLHGGAALRLPLQSAVHVRVEK
ncbi:MAG: prepilin-type N-terminal cleavage/methylation domain-containing protein [Magnetococcales bacterium]|nr:prepilin-type N-terminal cleavage/methylation domain-containing protein [Magnetococcales bacterium]